MPYYVIALGENLVTACNRIHCLVWSRRTKLGSSSFFLGAGNIAAPDNRSTCSENYCGAQHL